MIAARTPAPMRRAERAFRQAAGLGESSERADASTARLLLIAVAAPACAALVWLCAAAGAVSPGCAWGVTGCASVVAGLSIGRYAVFTSTSLSGDAPRFADHAEETYGTMIVGGALVGMMNWLAASAAAGSDRNATGALVLILLDTGAAVVCVFEAALERRFTSHGHAKKA